MLQFLQSEAACVCLRNHGDLVQLEIALVNLRGNLISNLDAIYYVLIVNRERHGHRTHPALDRFVTNSELFRAGVHGFDFASKGVRFFDILLCVSRVEERREQHSQRDKSKDRRSIVWSNE